MDRGRDLSRDVRCPACGRLLFRASGQGTTVEIKCKCSRIVTREADGRLRTEDLAATA